MRTFQTKISSKYQFLTFTCRVMKDGQLIENGNHEDLMAKDGEYKRLYDIQAQAFVPTGTNDSLPSQ